MFRSAAYTLGILFMAAFLSVHADTYLKYKKTTDSYTVAGKTVPETTGEAIAWVGSKQASYEDGEGHRSIFTFATKTLTVIDLNKKTGSTIKVDSMQSMINKAIDDNMEDAESAAATKEMMQGMMGAMMKGSMTVTKTSEQRKIGAWKCTKYLVDLKIAMGSTKSESWVTEQIKINPAAFNMIKNGMLALMPGFGDIAKEVEKIKGIPVKTVSTSQAMNTTIRSTELLLESAEKAAPKGIYSVPEGYKEQTIGSE
ncbi:MAG: hypothetical protein JW913_10785 [Chitinispirillaceae bacterium]|nr:hypothetical protein [Chitinispirillaceae bacterium]